MHKEQTSYVKKQLTKYKPYGNVVEIGSKDINGNNRAFLGDVNYIGLDLSAGPNVDVVAHFADTSYKNLDMIISTEALEHDCRWFETLQNIYKSLKKGGVAIITAAGYGRPEHGTRRSHPQDSPDTTDYYRNITMSFVYDAFNKFDVNVVDVVEKGGDIYFTIIKEKGDLRAVFSDAIYNFFGVRPTDLDIKGDFFIQLDNDKETLANIAFNQGNNHCIAMVDADQSSEYFVNNSICFVRKPFSKNDRDFCLKHFGKNVIENIVTYDLNNEIRLFHSGNRKSKIRGTS